MERQRILIVEDSSQVGELLQRGLTEEGFDVGVAETGEIALRKLNERWDLVVLDLMLPDLSGERIMAFLGQRAEHPRVLVLTAKAEVESKIELFKLGCDDYLTKPFAFEELLGRVKALLRRPAVSLPENVTYDDLKLEGATLKLKKGNDEVSLTPKEYAICRLLMLEPGRVVSRKELLNSVWGYTVEPKTNFMEVHLANLRKKLARLHCSDWLQTVRSSGVAFERPRKTD